MHPSRERLARLRDLFVSQIDLQGPPIEAYIVTSYDEHQNQKLDEADKRIKFISGFSGSDADVVVSFGGKFNFSLSY